MPKSVAKRSIPILLLYYWVVVNIIDYNNVESTEVFVFVQLPIIIYSIYSFIAVKFRLTKQTIGFVIYLLSVLLVNVVRGDLQLILSAFIDVLPIIIILSSQKYALNIKYINIFFLIQIVLAYLQFINGENLYGIFPFQGASLNYTWKVSLFAHMNPPFTAVFAFLILFINTEAKERMTLIRFIIVLLCLYFIVFAGSRTIYLSVGMYFLIKFIMKFFSLQNNLLFFLLFPILTFFIAIFGIEIIKGNISHDSILWEMLFREAQGGSDFESSDRYIMWNNYLAIFKENLVFGNGYFIPRDLIWDSPGSSETLLPLMLAYSGIVYFIFLIAILRLEYFALIRADFAAYFMIILFLVCISFYGSFMRGYNLIYIFIFYIYANNRVEYAK